MILVKKRPPDAGKKLMVLGLTSSPDLKSLDLTNAFNISLKMPMLTEPEEGRGDGNKQTGETGSCIFEMHRCVSPSLQYCLALPCLALSCWRAVSCLVLSCLVVLCRVVPCRVVSCRVVSCRVVSCRVVSCLVLLTLALTLTPNLKPNPNISQIL
jgi:hypothetical protein